MSYIDAIDHELVGLFAGLPVYRPLETITGSEHASRDFTCTPDQLVIGGGSGEHPGLVLRRPDCAVAYFISDWVESFDGEAKTVYNHAPLCTAFWEDYIDELLMTPREDILHFAGWTVRQFHDFYAACRSTVLHTPHDEERFPSFEAWLISSLGEFIFFSLPELLPCLDRDLPEARATIREVIYVNILVPPPGYRESLGRLLVDGHLQWGNLRWQSWEGEMKSNRPGRK